MIRMADGRPLLVAKPNPLIHPGVIDTWRIDDLTYRNWENFAPILGRVIIQCYEVKPPPVRPPRVVSTAAASFQPRIAPLPYVSEATPQESQIPKGRILYFYQLKNRNLFDNFYRERRGNVLEEKPISIRLLGEENDMFKIEKDAFVDGETGVPLPGSRILDDSNNRRYIVTDCIDKGSFVLVEVELER